MVELGSTVTDSLTKFTGIATARTVYLYGCVRVFVEPAEVKDGKPVEGVWFDEQRLDTQSAAQVGGPQNGGDPRRADPR